LPSRGLAKPQTSWRGPRIRDYEKVYITSVMSRIDERVEIMIKICPLYDSTDLCYCSCTTDKFWFESSLRADRRPRNQTAGCGRRQEQDEMACGCCRVEAAVASELLLRRREKNMIKGGVPSADKFMSLCHAPVTIKSLIREDLHRTCTLIRP
jgi:hypothetical protein